MGRKEDMITNVKFAVARLNDNLMMTKKTLINPDEVVVCVCVFAFILSSCCAHIYPWNQIGQIWLQSDLGFQRFALVVVLLSKKQLTF